MLRNKCYSSSRLLNSFFRHNLANYRSHAKTSFTDVFPSLMRLRGYTQRRLIQRTRFFKARRWNVILLAGTSSYIYCQAATEPSVSPYFRMRVREHCLNFPSVHAVRTPRAVPQVLQDLCRLLGLQDVSLLGPSVAKLTKVVQMLPRLERFVNR